MRTNLSLLPVETEMDSKFPLHKTVNYCLIPTWLDSVLTGLRLSETTLDDVKKVNSILTADDIKFYNENVAKIYELKALLGFPSDIYFKYLMDTTKYPGGFPVDACVELTSLGNSISKKEALTPFVQNIADCDPSVFWAVVVRYSITKLVESHFVAIRFELCAPDCQSAEQAKENEKLAEFYLGEFGIQHFANTELFKNLLTV